MQSGKYGAEEISGEIFSFLVETMEMAVKSWHESCKVDARVYFLLDKDKTDTQKYAPVVNIDKVIQPHKLFLILFFPCSQSLSSDSHFCPYIILTSLNPVYVNDARHLNHPIHTAVVFHFLDNMLNILSLEQLA